MMAASTIFSLSAASATLLCNREMESNSVSVSVSISIALARYLALSCLIPEYEHYKQC